MTGSRRTQLAFVILCCALLSGVCERARARHDGALELVHQHLRERGASEVTEVLRTFLFDGETTVHEATLSRDGCVAFFALGTGEVRDVDLAIFTRSGHPLAEDVAQSPYAYARVCGARGLRLYVSATLYAGRGELVLLRVEDAPRGIDRLPEAIQVAVSAGGRAEQVRSVGSAADDLLADLKLEQVEKSLVALGYRAVGTAGMLELRAGNAEGKVYLEAGRCYRIVSHVPVSRGVALEVTTPSGRRRETRAAHDDRADVAVCTEEAGFYVLHIQARPMRGVVVTRVFEHPAVRDPTVRALGDARALAWGEADTVAAARGFRLAPLGEAYVENSVPHTWPVSLEAGHCYAFAVIAEGGASAVDIRLVSGRGTLMARNEGRRGLPLVFACASGNERARLVLRARGREGTVAVWSGKNLVAAP